jgi:DNA repair protein RadD
MTELRPYQLDVINECRQKLAAGVSKICLVAPTGSGKTVIAAEIIRSAVAKGKRVLVLAHTREIIKQTSLKLNAAGIAHGIIMATDTVRPYEPVQVASVQTYWSRVMRTRRMDPPPADLVIVDECHHVRARTWRKIIDSYPGVPLIGLTATPCRSDGRGLGSSFNVLVECPQVAELIKLDFLVGTRTYAPAEIDLRGIRTQTGDYVVSELAERVNTAPLVGDIITHWFKYAAGLKTIVFAVNVAHSRHIAAEYNKAGIKAEHLDGSTPKTERDGIWAGWRRRHPGRRQLQGVVRRLRPPRCCLPRVGAADKAAGSVSSNGRPRFEAGRRQDPPRGARPFRRDLPPRLRRGCDCLDA